MLLQSHLTTPWAILHHVHISAQVILTNQGEGVVSIQVSQRAVVKTHYQVPTHRWGNATAR